MEDDVIILGHHNLDCSSLTNLAKDISNRLDINVEYGHFQKENEKYQYIALGTVTANENGVTQKLLDLCENESYAYKFVLEFGEIRYLIYNDFVEFEPPFEIMRYKPMERAFKKNDVTGDHYYDKNVISKLQKLGADKVYFIKNSFAPELAILANTTMKAYLKIIQKETTFFEMSLNN